MGEIKRRSDGAFAAAGLDGLGFEYKDHTQRERMAKVRIIEARRWKKRARLRMKQSKGNTHALINTKIYLGCKHIVNCYS